MFYFILIYLLITFVSSLPLVVFIRLKKPIKTYQRQRGGDSAREDKPNLFFHYSFYAKQSGALVGSH
jgi:hypothetical protein